MKKLLFALSLGTLSVLSANAQILLSGGLSYSQNFDTALPSTGTSGVWTDNTTPLPGWYAARATTGQAYTVFRIDNGANNSGSIFDYGATGGGDRALGSVASGTPGTNAIGLLFKNDTGSTWTGDISISYTGEQWRNGGNTSTQTILYFSYFVTSTDISAGPIGALYPDPNYTALASLDFISPTVGATAAALDGDNPANQAALSGTLFGITLNANDYIMLRWSDINDAGNDHGGGIDNLNVNFITVPEPTAAVLGGFALLGLGYWWRKRK